METILTSIIPAEITIEWIINLALAFLVGIIAGKVLKFAVWLGLIVIIVYILLQVGVIAPTLSFENFADSEQLKEMTNNIWEWIQNILPNIKEHIIANSTIFFSFIAGFIVSFFIGSKS